MISNTVWPMPSSSIPTAPERSRSAVRSTPRRKPMHPGKRVVTLCMAGCTLTAIPAAGHRFEGWYDDAEHSRKVADESRYAYVPTSPLRHLFAVFRPDTTPLDDKGTANCYIAPQLGTSYSFDATVTGNGRSTTNIRPPACPGSLGPGALGNGNRARRRHKGCRIPVGAHRFYNRHRPGKCRHRAVRRFGELHLVVAYLVRGL